MVVKSEVAKIRLVHIHVQRPPPTVWQCSRAKRWEYEALSTFNASKIISTDPSDAVNRRSPSGRLSYHRQPCRHATSVSKSLVSLKLRAFRMSHMQGNGRVPSRNGERQEIKSQHHDINGVSSVDEFRDAIQAHRERTYFEEGVYGDTSTSNVSFSSFYCAIDR
ncbi:hypothetical protein ARMGADRAFT_1037141 [Armillaria gallica]|uniref:Uncharacterized protein n=1 Tax=Armillaria gallica TaxID=47427 RepID=A0A2H3CN14_ARMGA|nr:hypothetical protein ARMGADRAFT_1037141 [Armillaria gallica]